jgi:hypothetical protein
VDRDDERCGDEDQVGPEGHGLRVLQLQSGLHLQLLWLSNLLGRELQSLRGDPHREGRGGDVDLSGLTVAAIMDWPKAIYDGGGKAVFVVPPEVTDEQLGVLAQIFTGQLGGMPWEILGTTYEVSGLVRSAVKINEAGQHSSVEVPGIGRATGATLKNPVTGEDNNVAIEPGTGFIWKRGDCGQGSFHVAAEGIKLDYDGSNWIHYRFDWSN